jgi:lysophospholipase L1-like esterase
MLMRKSHWADFYRNDHPARGLEITTLIIKAFYSHAQRTGRVPIVVIFPLSFDLIDYQKNKFWVYQPLLDDLAASGIGVFNIGARLADYLGQRNPCDLFTTCRNGGHFNQEGNTIAARLIADYLVRRNLVATPRPTAPSQN